MKPKLEKIILTLTGALIGVTLFTAPAIYSEKKDTIKKSINNFINEYTINANETAKMSLMKLSSHEGYLFGEKVNYIVFPGMFGVPCQNVVIVDYKNNKLER